MVGAARGTRGCRWWSRSCHRRRAGAVIRPAAPAWRLDSLPDTGSRLARRPVHRSRPSAALGRAPCRPGVTCGRTSGRLNRQGGRPGAERDRSCSRCLSAVGCSGGPVRPTCAVGRRRQGLLMGGAAPRRLSPPWKPGARGRSDSVFPRGNSMTWRACGHVRTQPRSHGDGRSFATFGRVAPPLPTSLRRGSADSWAPGRSGPRSHRSLPAQPQYRWRCTRAEWAGQSSRSSS